MNRISLLQKMPKALHFILLLFLAAGCGGNEAGRTEEGVLKLVSGKILNFTLIPGEESVNGLCTPGNFEVYLVDGADSVKLQAELVKDEHVYEPGDEITLTGIKVGGARLGDVYDPAKFTLKIQLPEMKDFTGKTYGLHFYYDLSFFKLKYQYAADNPGIIVKDSSHA